MQIILSNAIGKIIIDTIDIYEVLSTINYQYEGDERWLKIAWETLVDLHGGLYGHIQDINEMSLENLRYILGKQQFFEVDADFPPYNPSAIPENADT